MRVLPIDRDGYTWLVGQYCYASGAYSWELPSGGADLGEVPQQAAAREMREETGLQAVNWIELNRLVPSGSVTDAREMSFLAWDLQVRDRDPDPQEVIRRVRIPFQDALQMALSGEITNAGTVATLLGAYVKAPRGDLPPEVADRPRQER